MRPCGSHLGPILVPLHLVRRVYSTLNAVRSTDYLLRQVSLQSERTPTKTLESSQLINSNETVTSLEPQRREQSHRWLKRTRRSPSEALVEALKLAGADFAVPHKPAHKVDLSYVNARTFNRRLFRRTLADQKLQLEHKREDHSQSLQSILVEYFWIDSIYGTGAISEHSRPAVAKQMLTRCQQNVLAARGYTVDDVEDWHAILTTRDVDSATRLLLHHVPSLCPETIHPKKPLPTFVLLFLLRRQNISPSALRTVLIFTWQELHRMEMHHRRVQSQGTTPEQSDRENRHFPVLDNASVFLLVVRLLRHARAIWPEALVSIAAIVTTHIGFPKYVTRSKTSLKKHETNVARITAWYNKILSLLAIPAHLSPFHSVAFHQRSQFDVLRRMAEHDPPLAINREGYRAIVSVQLQNKKTDQEREWAQLKAKSWPPWKEDKTGLDAEKGPEYGVSRALQAIRCAREAGYGDLTWEKTATILSGWDVDGSPTIQTRALLFHKLIMPSNINSQPKVLEHLISSNNAADVPAEWAARVRATRTIQEAWACFLAYGDRHNPATESVYFALLSKIKSKPVTFPLPGELHSESRNPGILQYAEREFVAGDSPAPLPIPESPKEMTYVRTQPPSFDELVEEMFQNKIVPQGGKLAFLLANAKRLSHGLKYIKWVAMHIPSYKSLLTDFPERDERFHDVPDDVVAAYILLLVKFSGDRAKSFSLNDYDPAYLADITYDENPLIFIIRLLRSRKGLSLRPWHSVLFALAPPDILNSEQKADKSDATEYVEKYSFLCRIFREMKNVGLTPTTDTFSIMCQSLENVIVANLEAFNNDREVQRSQKELKDKYAIAAQTGGVESTDGWSLASLSLNQFEKELNGLFVEIFGHGNLDNHSESFKSGSSTKNTTIPSLLATPYPRSLHTYMRVLGWQRNWSEMLNLLEWMVSYQDEIAAAIDMPRNGPKLLRRTLVAARVFLERSWVNNNETKADEYNTDFSSAGAPEHIIARARQLITEVQAWRGWPLDEEVEEYCRRGRYPRSK